MQCQCNTVGGYLTVDGCYPLHPGGQSQHPPSVVTPVVTPVVMQRRGRPGHHELRRRGQRLHEHRRGGNRPDHKARPELDLSCHVNHRHVVVIVAVCPNKHGRVGTGEPRTREQKTFWAVQAGVACVGVGCGGKGGRANAFRPRFSDKRQPTLTNTPNNQPHGERAALQAGFSCRCVCLGRHERHTFFALYHTKTAVPPTRVSRSRFGRLQHRGHVTRDSRRIGGRRPR